MSIRLISQGSLVELGGKDFGFGGGSGVVIVIVCGLFFALAWTLVIYGMASRFESFQIVGVICFFQYFWRLIDFTVLI